MPHHDSFIGIFERYSYPGRFGYGASGQPQNGLIFHTSIVEETQIDGAAAAQEMAHNLGWVTATSPLDDGTGHLRLTPAPGYWVAKDCQMGFYKWSASSGELCDATGGPSDFMGAQGVSHPNDVLKWISKPTWDYLLALLRM